MIARTSPPKMTAELFDAVAIPKPRPEKLWGRPAIAQVLGVSEETVAKWAKEPDTPIYEPKSRRYFARRSELETWMRTKQPA